MGNLAALKVKLREIGCDVDGDRAILGAIATEVIFYLSAADMHIDYNATLLIDYTEFESSSVWQSSF